MTMVTKESVDYEMSRSRRVAIASMLAAALIIAAIGIILPAVL